MKYLLKILTVVVLVNICLHAQDDEYKKWLENENTKYQNYLSEEDKKFEEFLKKEWINAPLAKTPKLITKPKQLNPVVVDLTKENKKENTLPVKVPVVLPQNIKTNKPVSEVNKKTPLLDNKPITVDLTPKAPGTAKTRELITTDFDYFGVKEEISYDVKSKYVLHYPLSNNEVARYWSSMCSSDYNSVLRQMLGKKETLKLNDWGYGKLLFETGNKIYADVNTAYLFTWFMLVKSGYLCRSAFNENNIYVLTSSNDIIYGSTYFYPKGAKGKFLLLSFTPDRDKSVDNVNVYKDDFPGSTKMFSYRIESLPVLSNDLGFRDIKYSYLGTPKNIRLTYNKAAIKYFEYYPQCSFDYYPVVDITAKSDLINYLNNETKGFNEKEKLNYILNFVQYASEYKTDPQQFNREKVFFPEESVYYSYSDCDDRAGYFAYLVRTVLHLDVVLLSFPDHICTAVACKGSIPGDFIAYEGKNYLICDPTYFGASAGKCMPQYKNTSADVIVIN